MELVLADMAGTQLSSRCGARRPDLLNKLHTRARPTDLLWGITCSVALFCSGVVTMFHSSHERNLGHVLSGCHLFFQNQSNLLL